MTETQNFLSSSLGKSRMEGGQRMKGFDFYSSVLIHFDGPNNRSLMSITSGLSARIKNHKDTLPLTLELV